GLIGTLEPGKAADLVLMPWRHLAYPYLDPAVSVLDAVVHRGKVSGVETVLVAGAPVLRDGQIVRVAKAAVLEQLATTLRQPLSPEEAHRQQLARDVFQAQGLTQCSCQFFQRSEEHTSELQSLAY